MVRSRGGELDIVKLLDPVSAEVFLRDYFEKKPIYIPGRRDKFKGLFDRATLDAIFRDQARLLAPDVLVAADVKKAGGPAIYAVIQPGAARAMFAAGATVCASRLEQVHPPLKRLVTTIKAQLNYAGVVDVRAYLSPDGAGFDTHFDPRVAMTLQIAGRKRWWFAPGPAIEFPLKKHDPLPRRGGRGKRRTPDRDDIAAPDERAFRSVELRPGDVLCLPPGTWHRASAAGESLALNVAFNYSAWKSPDDEQALPFFALLESALHSSLAPLVDWRRAPPAVPYSLDDSGEVPVAVRAFVEARIKELGAALQRLDPGGPEIGRAWRRFVCYGPADRSARATSIAVQRTDILLTPGPGLLKIGLGRADRGESPVSLYCASPCVEAEFAHDALPFLRKLSQVRRFQAASATKWGGAARYAWRDLRGVLDSLLEAGVLRRES